MRASLSCHFSFKPDAFSSCQISPRATFCILLLCPLSLRFASKPHKSCLFTSLHLQIPPRPPIIPAIHLRNSSSSRCLFWEGSDGNGAWRCSWSRSRSSPTGCNGAFALCRAPPAPSPRRAQQHHLQWVPARTFPERLFFGGPGGRGGAVTPQPFAWCDPGPWMCRLKIPVPLPSQWRKPP